VQIEGKSFLRNRVALKEAEAVSRDETCEFSAGVRVLTFPGSGVMRGFIIVYVFGAVAGVSLALVGCRPNDERITAQRDAPVSASQRGEESLSERGGFEYLPVGDPEVIRIFQDNLSRCQAVYKMIHALAEAHAKGGEGEPIAAYHLAIAEAKLGWTKGDWDGCERAAAEAVKHGERMIAGNRDMDLDPYQSRLLDNIGDWSDARLILHEARLRKRSAGKQE